MARFINRRFALIQIQNEMFYCPDDKKLNKDEALLKLNFKSMLMSIVRICFKKKKTETELFVDQ